MHMPQLGMLLPGSKDPSEAAGPLAPDVNGEERTATLANTLLLVYVLSLSRL